MVLFVVLLAGAVLASGMWCATSALLAPARTGSAARPRLTTGAVALGVVVGAGALLRVVLVPAHHAMYMDEPWYAEAACNLARSGRPVLCETTWSGIECRPYGKGLGWPVLLAAWARLFGCHTASGIAINRALGSMTVFLVALGVRCAGGRWPQAIVAAALLALHPVHVAWSSTGETNVSAAAMFLAGLCGALLYLRTGRASGATLAVSGLGLATAIRPELGLPGIASGAVMALTAWATARSRAVVGGATVLICGAAIASGVDLWRMNESISGGAFLSLGNVVRNALPLLNPSALLVHAVVPITALCGAVAIARSEYRVVWLLGCAGIAAALGVLAYDRFDERMLLSSTVALLPLSGFSLSRSTARVGEAPSGTIRRIIAAGTIRPRRRGSSPCARTQFLQKLSCSKRASPGAPPPPHSTRTPWSSPHTPRCWPRRERRQPCPSRLRCGIGPPSNTPSMAVDRSTSCATCIARPAFRDRPQPAPAIHCSTVSSWRRWGRKRCTLDGTASIASPVCRSVEARRPGVRKWADPK